MNKLTLFIVVLLFAAIAVTALRQPTPADRTLDAHHPKHTPNGNHRGDRHLRQCTHAAVASTQRLYVADGSHPLTYNKNNQQHKKEEEQPQEEEQQHEAEALASSPDWRTLRIQFNTSLVLNPSADVDVETGKPYSCATEGAIVFAGGQDSGFDCFDPATGQRLFQNFCRLTCQANETLNSTLMLRLRSELDKVASYLQSELEVPSSDNISVTVRSDPSASCGGMGISPPRRVIGKDLVVMVTARPTRQLGNVDAAAMACQVHEGSNRPVLIHVNINPIVLHEYYKSAVALSSATTSGNGQSSGAKQTVLFDEVVHQMVHALGMSNASYPLYKHPDDRNKTYYEFSPALFPTGPVGGAGIVDAGAGSFVLDPARIAAGEKIYFKGPNVRKVAERYFKCVGGTAPLTSALGVELENGGNSQTVTGVHWEKRILLEELLLGTASPEMYLSMFTWALLQDTGYLNVPRLAAQQHWDTTPMAWGREMGCEFLTKKCSQWNGLSTAATGGSATSYFCSEPNTPGCGFDGSFMGLCDVQLWGSAVPAPYQYFSSNGGRKAGPDGLADYCPINRLIVQGRCTDPNNGLVSDRKSKQGMSFGGHSRCFVNRVISASFSQPGGSSLTSCYEAFCGGSSNNNNAYIVVGKETAPCTRDTEILELFPPARFNTGNFSLTTAGATVQLSYKFHGMLQCDTLVSYCQAGANGKRNISIPTIGEALPTVESVEPPWGDPTGGTTVTLLGTDLSRCTSAIVGGVALSEFVAINATAAKGVLGNVGQTGGGPTPADGTGDALVELQCYVANSVSACSSNKGCIVARTKGVFNYSFTDPRIPLRSGVGVFSDFFDSVAGKVVGIIMCVVVIIILIVLARLCFKDGHKVGEKIEGVEGIDDDGQDDPAATKKKSDSAADTSTALVAGDGSGGADGAAAAAADGGDATIIDGINADIEGLPYDDPEEMTVLI